MKTKVSQKKLLHLFLIGSLILILANCATKKPFWGDPQSGLILQYRFPVNERLIYKMSNKIVQNLEVMGNTIENTFNTSYTVSYRSKGIQKDHNQLTVTIDTMNTEGNTPQGNFSPKLDQIIGKSFGMRLSTLGKERNLEGALALKYDLGPQGKRSIVSDFQSFFPNVPEKALRVGDSWVALDTINLKDENTETRMALESKNTLIGFEKINNFECAKVSADVKGVLEGKGQQRGADLVFKGNITASETWYFAYKEGIYLQGKSEGNTDAQIEVSGPGNMTIPMKMKMSSEASLTP